MPSQRAIRLVRRVLLLTLIGFAGVIAFLLWFGQRRPEGPLLARTRATEPGQLDVDVSTGFDYTISVGGRDLMRVRADRVVSRAGERVELHQIGPIELYRSDGETVFVRADRGSVDIETGGASLIGNVELQGPDGTSLKTDQMDLAGEGKVVRSRGVVELSRGQDMTGAANRLTADLEANTIALLGRVRFTVRDTADGPDYRLAGRRATYYPDELRVHLAGGVTLSHGEGSLKAREMTAFGGEQGGLDLIKFRRGVNGRWFEPQAQGPPVEVGILSQDLDLDFGPEGELVETRLRRHRPAELWLQQGPRRQSLSGINIDIQWSGGQPLSGNARTHAQLVESTPQGGRSAVSDSIDFRFAGGAVSAITMRDNVRVQEEDGTTTGNRATYVAKDHKFTVTGEPARTTFPSGEVTSPQIVYYAAERTAVAVAPVRGQFQRGREPGVISGETPSRFEAREATWDQANSTVTISGEARIWEGRDLLVADRISSDLERRSVEADGDVRVILEQQGSGPDGAPVRVEAASDRMTYDEAERVIHMIGESTAQREKRTLSCADLDVVLLADGEAEKMLCSGGTRLLDPVAGRTVTGQTAVYEIAAKEALFTGDPVMVEGDDGSRVSGLRLRYRLETGEAIMDVGERPPAPEASAEPIVLISEGEAIEAAAPEATPPLAIPSDPESAATDSDDDG